MNHLITLKEYLNYYDAVGNDPEIFKQLLSGLEYDLDNLTLHIVGNEFHDLINCNTRHIILIKHVDNNLTVPWTTVHSLPHLESVNGYLDVSFTMVSNLCSLKRVEGNLKINDSELKSLPSLEYVGGDMNVSMTPILAALLRKYPISEISTIVKQLYNVQGNINIIND